jgi:hypothetical protein
MGCSYETISDQVVGLWDCPSVCNSHDFPFSD